MVHKAPRLRDSGAGGWGLIRSDTSYDFAARPWITGIQVNNRQVGATTTKRIVKGRRKAPEDLSSFTWGMRVVVTTWCDRLGDTSTNAE